MASTHGRRGVVVGTLGSAVVPWGELGGLATGRVVAGVEEGRPVALAEPGGDDGFVAAGVAGDEPCDAVGGEAADDATAAGETPGAEPAGGWPAGVLPARPNTVPVGGASAVVGLSDVGLGAPSARAPKGVAEGFGERPVGVAPDVAASLGSKRSSAGSVGEAGASGRGNRSRRRGGRPQAPPAHRGARTPRRRGTGGSRRPPSRPAGHPSGRADRAVDEDRRLAVLDVAHHGPDTTRANDGPSSGVTTRSRERPVVQATRTCRRPPA